MRRLALLSLVAFSGVGPAHGEEAAMEMKVLKTTEHKDRVVDQAAVAIQREGIRRIEKLLAGKLPLEKEGDLIFQLAVARLEAAAIQFRISHEKAHRGGAKLDLTAYTKEMSEAVKVLTRFLVKFPKDPRVPEVIFLRGTAHDESKSKALAQKDFEDLVKRFPEVPETSPALMRLSEFAVDDEDHARAVRYLAPLEKRLDDPHYPFAIYKLAWAHFNLVHVRSALDYLGKHIKFYDDRFHKYGNLESSEMAIRENSLKDISLFFFEGIQKDLSGFSLDKAFKEFQTYAGINPTDVTVIRFTALLRTRDNRPELSRWSDLVMNSTYKPATKLAALNVLFENQQNRRLYAEMEPDMERLKRILVTYPELEGSEQAVELKRIVEAGAKDLHKAIVDNRKSQEVGKLVSSLEELYGLVRMLSIKDKSDSVKSYFNLAETYFDLKDYPKATEYYRKAYVERLEVKKAPADLMATKDFFMRALASRFEELRKSKEIPESIAASALTAEAKPVKLSERFEQWASWIAEARSMKGLSADDTKVVTRYEWDRQRTLYMAGRRSEVVTEIAAELKDLRALDEFSEPKLDLWMDTLVASQSWTELHDLTKKWNKKATFKKSEVADRMRNLESDSFIKQIEGDFKSGNSQAVLDKTEQCEKNYAKQDDKLLKCQILASEVLATREQWPLLLKKLDVLGNKVADPKLSKRISDLRLEAFLALQKYEEALEIHMASNESNRLDAMFDLTLMVQNTRAYRRLASDNAYCAKAFENCRLLRAVIEMRGEDADFKMNFGDIFKAHRPYRAIYSLASVGSFKTSLVDRMKIFRVALDSWRDLDSRVYWTAMPELATWIDTELKTNRQLLSRNYPLRADSPESVATRFQRIKDFESSLESLSKTLPLSNLRASVLRGAAGSYEDVVAELKSTLGDAAKDFVKPLEDKKQKILAQALALEKTTQAEVEAKLALLKGHIVASGEVKALDDLSKGRFVAAKMQQDTLRKEKKLAAFNESYINAAFFHKLGAWNESMESLGSAEEHLNKLQVAGGMR